MHSDDAMMLYGEYHDTIRSGRAPPHVSGWRSNRIVSSVWPLVAALLRGEPGMRGIAYCAVGEGLDSWDAAFPSRVPDTTRLVHELARVPIAFGDISYIDAAGGVASTPTHRLAITVTVTAPANGMRLREFSLVGGEATAAPDTGRSINYVIHPRIDLAPRSVLTRSVRFSFRPGGGSALTDHMLELPPHWLEKESTELVDGVGAKVRDALKTTGVSTIGELARFNPRASLPGIPATKAIELRGKARLALRTAGTVPVMNALNKLSMRDILAGDARSLPGNLSAIDVERLHEQLTLLQLSLDARFLARTTLADLTRDD